MMVLRYFMLAIVWPVANTLAQSPVSDIRPLTIGDSVPDIVFTNLVNYPVFKSQSSKLKNKLLILDFMHTSCVGCIKALPGLDSLQARYGSKIQIAAVTPEKEDRVKQFLKRNKIGHSISIPVMAEGDTLLKRYFPYEYFPHEVWIYKGRVKAITSSQYVDARNIQAVIDGAEVHWPVKRDITDYDCNLPLLTLNDNALPKFSMPVAQYHSAFTACIANLPQHSRTVTDSIGQTVRTYMINIPIIDMYLKTYNLSSSFPVTHIVLLSKDTASFFYNPETMYEDEWNRKYSFCYEALFPLAISKQRRQEKIRADIKFFTGVTGRLERRKVQCWVLIKKGHGKKELISPSAHPTREGDTISISSIVRRLNESRYSIPVLDESGLPGRTHLQMPPSFYQNRQAVKAVFEEYGLTLTKAEREIEMLIISTGS